MNNNILDIILISATFATVLLDGKNIFIEISKYKKLNKEFNDKLSCIKNIVNDDFVNAKFKQYFSDNIFRKDLLLYEKKSIIEMYLVVQYSTDYFLRIYTYNDILSCIKVKKKDYFENIICYCKQNSKLKNVLDKKYDIYKNIDLLKLSRQNDEQLIITNINDYKNSHNDFELQYIEDRCNALISIPVYDKNKKIIACYTTYFKHSLDDRISLKKISPAIENISKILNDIIYNYFDIRNNSYMLSQQGQIINGEYSCVSEIEPRE